jgi:prolyl 4-hydroxylase
MSSSIVLLLLAVLVGLSQADLFTAMVSMERLLDAENGVASDLRRFVEQQTQRLERLTRLADDLEKHSADALADPERYLGNPVNAYLLIKRFTTEWQKVVDNDIRSNDVDEFLIGLRSKTCYFPDHDDLVGAARALFRLQDVYALPSDKLARGELVGVIDSPHLAAEDCFHLGQVAYNTGDYYHTILWMTEALHVVDDETVKTADKALILDYLSYAVYMQGNIFHALNLTNLWLEIEPDHARAMNNKRFYEQMLADELRVHPRSAAEQERMPLRNERPRDEYRRTESFNNYEKLCRGEETTDYPLKHELTCHYARHHPSLWISPVKVEQVHIDPPINVFYDVLTPSQMAMVKQLAEPRLSRSVVFHSANSQGTTAQDYRISKSAWLMDSDDPVISHISQKARVLANLTLDTAEQWQVLNYGIGGHYETHCDFATKRERTTFEIQQGNRIATFICYISDVKAGGKTVFPDIGVQLTPRKGTCGLWYNLRKSGDGDFLTRHAACPVLSGYKWACNKWFHERGQEFIRPCTQSPAE